MWLTLDILGLREHERPNEMASTDRSMAAVDPKQPGYVLPHLRKPGQKYEPATTDSTRHGHGQSEATAAGMSMRDDSCGQSFYVQLISSSLPFSRSKSLTVVSVHSLGVRYDYSFMWVSGDSIRSSAIHTFSIMLLIGSQNTHRLMLKVS